MGLVESNLMCQLELANSTMGMFQTFDSNKTTMFIVVLHSHNSECEQIFNASTTSLEQPTTLLHSNEVVLSKLGSITSWTEHRKKEIFLRYLQSKKPREERVAIVS